MVQLRIKKTIGPRGLIEHFIEYVEYFVLGIHTTKVPLKYHCTQLQRFHPTTWAPPNH